MATIDKGCIVRSVAGRDKDKLFFVLDVADGKAWLADGDYRRVGNPKCKSIKHLVFYAENKNERFLSRILQGARLEDAEIRKAMRMLKEEVL